MRLGIFAADIAGYSRLVAEDEEETLRRLTSYRAVTDDFIAKSGGRIFNTAGDAVLRNFQARSKRCGAASHQHDAMCQEEISAKVHRLICERETKGPKKA